MAVRLARRKNLMKEAACFKDEKALGGVTTASFAGDCGTRLVVSVIRRNWQNRQEPKMVTSLQGLVRASQHRLVA